jgi:DNA-binding MarR family transcriptional regulator
MIDDSAALASTRTGAKNRGVRKLDRGELDDAVGFVLRRALMHQDQEFMEVMGATGTTAGRFAILNVIERNPGCRISDLGASIGIGPNNIVPLLDALLASGLVARTLSDRDRRAKRLNLTELGRCHLAKLRQTHEAITERIHARMGPENLEKLIELLWLLAGNRDA